jgi:hypothetical protein
LDPDKVKVPTPDLLKPEVPANILEIVNVELVVDTLIVGALPERFKVPPEIVKEFAPAGEYVIPLNQMPLLVTLMDPEVLLKTAVLVCPFILSHGLPVTPDHPLELVFHVNALLVFVEVAA